MAPVKPYQVDIYPETVVFMNGFKARNIIGFIWLWVNLFEILSSVKKSEGCIESIPALAGPFQVVMISYWRNKNYLNQYVKSGQHQKYMSFVYKYPEALTLFNETYQPHRSGLYHNEPTGLAKLFPRLPITGEKVMRG